jgi:hypothetical protein
MNELQLYSFIHLGCTYKKMNIFISVHLLREDSRVSKREHMTNKFIYTAAEYANKLNLTASALRKRRLAGKLEGLYELRDNEYFYADGGPNKDSFTPLNSRSKKRRKVPSSMTRYTSSSLQKANDLKQLMRIQRMMKEEEIEHITPDIIAVAKQRHREELDKKLKHPFLPNQEQVLQDKFLIEQDERLEREQKNFRNPFATPTEADEIEDNVRSIY